MKKLLMVAPYFLPRRRVGSLRPFKFAIHLKEYGWEPHILTIASDGQLTNKEQRLLQDISTYAFKPPFDRTGRSGSQLTQSKSKRKKTSFSVGDWIDKHFPVDTWLPFFVMNWRRIKQIAQEIQPDAVWSTGDPWSGHWVGKKIANMFPDIFWMADFRDPWTLSETDLKKRSSFASVWDQKIERNWIQKASMLSFTTDSTRRLYENHYDDLDLSTATIYNAFDWQLFDEQNKVSDLKLDPKKLNLMFFGRFRRLSTAKPVIDILSKLEEMYPSVTEKISVHSFGPLTESDRNYLKRKELGHCFVMQEPVPAEQGLQVLKKADLLLLSTNPERTDIIPAKLWDYLAAGRPILSIAPNAEIIKILQETGTGVQYPPKEHEEVAKLLNTCMLAKERGDQLPVPFSWDRQKVEQYSARAATEKLANILGEHSG